jgi:uncharacterized protein HemY
MRKFLLFAIIGGLGALYVVQKQHEQASPTAKAQTSQAPETRQASEHDWAKHSLDRANEVKSQVQEQRKEDGVVDSRRERPNR